MKDAILAAVFLAAAFLFCTYASCLISKTVSANSNTDNPPNKFQWEQGLQCTKAVWADYYKALFI